MEKNEKVSVAMFPQSDGAVAVLLCEGTLWLNRKRMSIVFGARLRVVQDLIDEVLRLEQPQYRMMEYQARTYYSLSVVMAVAMRLNSADALVFASWAGARLGRDVVSESIVDEGRRSATAIMKGVVSVVEIVEGFFAGIRARVVDTIFVQGYNSGVRA